MLRGLVRRMVVASLLAGVAAATGCALVASLGDDTANDVAATDAAACTDGASVKELTAGFEFACLLRCDGTVWCWGANDHLQLGHDPDAAEDPSCPITAADALASPPCNPTPTRVEGISDAVHVSAGTYFACATLADGGAVCWGA